MLYYVVVREQVAGQSAAAGGDTAGDEGRGLAGARCWRRATGTHC